MKVILLDNVDGVGKKGETREVRDGYGRNFLVPRGFAMPATHGAIKKVQEQAKRHHGEEGKGRQDRGEREEAARRGAAHRHQEENGRGREAFRLRDG